MRLHKRGDTWHASGYDARGKRWRLSTKQHDKRAAELVARQFERDLADPTRVASKATLGDALDLLVKHSADQARSGARSAHTAAMYRARVVHLRRVLRGETPLYSLDATQVDRYCDTRRKEGASGHTLYKDLSALRMALKLARRAQIWTGDPIALLPIGLGTGYKPRERVLSEDELPLLLGALAPRTAAWAAFCVATGARASEACNARREDIAEDYSTVRLRGTKTKGSDRTVPVALPAQRAWLGWALDRAAPGARLFTCSRQAPGVAIAEACKRTGLKHVSPNDLRRTFATRLREAGAPLDLIAASLGHTDSRMVERVYGRLDASTLAARLTDALR